MKLRKYEKRAGTNCVGEPTLETQTGSPYPETQKQAFPYKESGMARRTMLTLLALGGASIAGGVSLVTVNLNLFGIGRDKPGQDPFSRMAELTFPPPKTKVPRKVYLRGRFRKIDPSEDLRVQVRNHKGQYWYKKMRFGSGDEIFRDDHHFGLVGEVASN